MEIDPWKTPVKPILENFESTSPAWSPRQADQNRKSSKRYDPGKGKALRTE